MVRGTLNGVKFVFEFIVYLFVFFVIGAIIGMPAELATLAFWAAVICGIVKVVKGFRNRHQEHSKMEGR